MIVSSSSPWSVSDLVQRLKSVVEPVFHTIAVHGECSGVKHHSSGHWYLTLKDEQSQIRAVIFRRDAQQLTFPLQDGLHVLVTGRLGVFERDGQTTLYIKTVEPVGVGADKLAREALYRRLAAEGLFNRPPRPLPRIPLRIAVITAATGAARRDIEAVRRTRCPGIPITLIPATVQGPQAVPTLLQALAIVSTTDADVLIIGRGGGATEDLRAFDDEAVVRAIAACPIPVISAVGHEIDTTFSDYAADYRAPTPSAAAELAVPALTDLRQHQADLAHRWTLTWSRHVTQRVERWRRIADHPFFRDPAYLLTPYETRWNVLAERWDRAWQTYTTAHTHRQQLLATRLAALDPTAILARGYAYVTDAAGHVVTAANAPATVHIHWHDGTRTYTQGDETL